jgi:hypothetical protein
VGDDGGDHRAQYLAAHRGLPGLARLIRAAPLLLLLGLAAPPLLAQSADPHAAQPERPTVATHAGTVAPGWLEIETGVELDRFRDRTHGTSVPTVLKLGVARRVQLTVSLPFLSHTGTSFGAADFSAGLKWRVVERKGIIGRFAVLPVIKLPTGSSSAGRGTGTTDVSLLLISSHELGGVAMDLNAGVTRRSGDGTGAPRTSTVWTASFGYPLRGRLGGVGELYGYPRTTGPAGEAGIVALLGGPTWQARDWLVFDAGVIVPVAGPQPWAIYAGLTWNAGRYWPGGRRAALPPAPKVRGVLIRSGR